MKSTKVFWGDAVLEIEDSNERGEKYPIELEYYKIRSNRTNLVEEEYEVYGIEIIKKEYIGDKVNIESECVENITKNENTLNKVMKILRDNTVTPITLNDVISDMFHE